MKTLRFAILSLALLVAAPALAEEPAAAPKMTPEQEAMMAAWQKAATPGPQHEQLKSLVGTWTTKASMWMDPSAPPDVSAGTATNTLIYGGRYLESKYSGVWNNEKFEGQGISGYQNVDGTWFATWFDSMSTGYWLSKGSWDEASKSWTYHGEMPDPMAPKTTIKVRTVTRLVDADHHVFEWYEVREGKELKTMQIEYTRAK